MIGLMAVSFAIVCRMTRPILDETRIHPAIREKIATWQADIIREVQDAAAANAVLVVGMRQNPMPKKARKLLEIAGVAHKYLEYGSYLSGWRRRNALKLWTGWPTFPMVFVKGVLVGGAEDLARLHASGELAKLLA
jgi:glutaredoxin-related protein